MRTFIRSGLGVSLAAALLLAGSACGGGGGGGGGRPSTSDLSTSLRSGAASSFLGETGQKLDKATADCIAKALHDSKVSDAGLRAIEKGDNSYQPSAADSKAATSFAGELTKCVPGAPTP